VADYTYTIGATVDSSGIDAFIQKVRSLANVNFGGSFNIPGGVPVSGPGVTGAPGSASIDFPGGGNPLAYAQSLQAASVAALGGALRGGRITQGEYQSGLRQVQEITNALLRGARRFDQIMGGARPTAGPGGAPGYVLDPDSGLVVKEEVIRQRAADQARVAQAQYRAQADADAANVRPASSAERAAALQTEANELRARELRTAQLRLVAARTELGHANAAENISEDIVRVRAQTLLAEQQIARNQRHENQRQYREASAAGYFSGGSFTQRLQARIRSRGGDLVDPETQPRLGQLAGQRVFQASSFALGGLAFYGALDVIRDTLEETTKLEREFAVVRGQLNETFGDRGGQAMDTFRQRVREISEDTGQLGSEIAFVGRQLAAAFVDPAAAPGVQNRQFNEALTNTEAAFRFAEITGLSSAEITDSLTALGLSFDELAGDFTPVLDQAINLEERFGVLGGQIITFAADLAPLAANLGFSAEQLQELGAVAQKFTGRSGGVLAEQFGRILTDLPQQSDELLAIFSRTPELADLSAGLADAFVSENMEQVLEFIAEAAQRVQSQNLDSGLVQQISEAVAGRREGATFAAILRRPLELLTALREPNEEAAGAVDRRWGEVRDSIEETMSRLRRSIEQFAQAILESGLADAFQTVAETLGILARAGGAVIRFFDELNDFLGGIPGQVFILVGAFKALEAAMRAASTAQLFGLIAGGAPGARNIFGRVADLGFVGAGQAAYRAAPGALSGLGARIGAGVTGGYLPAVAAGLGGSLGAYGFGAAGFGGAAFGAGGTGAFLGSSAALSPAAIATAAAIPIFATIATVEALRTRSAEVENQQIREDELARRLQQTDLRSVYDTIARNQFTDVVGLPGNNALSRFGEGALNRVIGYTAPGEIAAEAFASRVSPEAFSAGLQAIDIDSLTDSGRERYNEAIEEITSAMAGEEADLESVARFLGDVNDPGIVTAIEEYTRAAEAAQEVASGASGPQFQQLVQALSAGRATPELVRQALETAIAPYEEMLAAAERAGDYAGVLAQLEAIAALQEAADQAISNYEANYINFGEQLRGLVGDSTPTSQIDAATRILNNANVTDPTVRLNAIQALQAARDAALQRALETAQSEAYVHAAFEQFGGVDPIARAEAIYQAINAAGERRSAYLRQVGSQLSWLDGTNEDVQTELDAIEGLTSDEIASVSELLVQDIAAYGEGAITIRLALLRARARELQTMLRFGGIGGSVRDELQSELDTVLGQIDTFEEIDASGINPLDIPTGENGESERELQRQQDRAIADRRQAVLQAQAAGTADAQQQARIAAETARLELEYAVEHFGPDSVEAIRARGQLAAAGLQAANAAANYAQAVLAIEAARAAGDPVASAQVAIRAANVAIANARAIGDLAAEAQGIAQLVSAQNQARDAANDLIRANLELAITLAENDPVQQALLTLDLGNFEIAAAQGEAAEIRARINQIENDRAFVELVRDIAQSRTDLAVAIAESAGDAVEATQLLLTDATDELNWLLLTRPEDEIAINEARANQAQAARNAADAQLQAQQSDIDFALEMGQVTTRQAIEMYRALLSIPTNTEEQNREIQLTIQQLTDQLGQDFQFNLPTSLGIPTLYEARRAGGTADLGVGYQDNRQIVNNIQINGSNLNEDQLTNAVLNAVGDPKRNAPGMRRY
jgi:hypothetical protein